MLKLTRLNNQVVAINPDHIGWVETTPDTTLFLIGGDKIIVRESLDELIAAVVHFRRLVRMNDSNGKVNILEGDPPQISDILPLRSDPSPRISYPGVRSFPPRGSR